MRQVLPIKNRVLSDFLKTVFVQMLVWGLSLSLASAFICPEYFPVTRPTILKSLYFQPVILACLWGIFESSFVALMATLALRHTFGSDLASFSRLQVRANMYRLQILVSFLAVLIGLCGYEASTQGLIKIPIRFQDEIESSRGPVFYFVVFAHCTCWIGAFLATIRLRSALKKELQP